MGQDTARFEALRATVSQSAQFTEATALAFLRQQPEFRNRDIEVRLESESVKAGVSAGHVFIRIAGPGAGPWEGRYVVRFDGGADRLFRQTSLRNQFDVMRALHTRGLPVPEALWFDDAGVMASGTAALVMRRIDAEPPQNLYMERGPYVAGSPARRRTLLDNMMGFSAQLHALPVRELGVPFLAERGGKGGHFVDREIAWMQAELSSRFPETEDGERAPLMRRLRQACDTAADWLRGRAPRHREPVLVHGDLTLANVIFKEDGSIAAMLDWELCHEGLPEEDITWFVLAARSMVNFYDAKVVAFPRPAEVIEAYRRTGATLEDLDFAAVLSAYRLAAISALAMRGMPREFWPSLPAIWDKQERILVEAIERFEQGQGVL